MELARNPSHTLWLEPHRGFSALSPLSSSPQLSNLDPGCLFKPGVVGLQRVGRQELVGKIHSFHESLRGPGPHPSTSEPLSLRLISGRS